MSPPIRPPGGWKHTLKLHARESLHVKRVAPYSIEYHVTVCQRRSPTRDSSDRTARARGERGRVDALRGPGGAGAPGGVSRLPSRRACGPGAPRGRSPVLPDIRHGAAGEDGPRNRRCRRAAAAAEGATAPAAGASGRPASAAVTGAGGSGPLHPWPMRGAGDPRRRTGCMRRLGRPAQRRGCGTWRYRTPERQRWLSSRYQDCWSPEDSPAGRAWSPASWAGSACGAYCDGS